MRRSFKFLLRPTGKQATALAQMLADHCSRYNGALQERRDAYRHVSKTTVRYGDQSAQLKDIRRGDPERQGRWSFSSQQATLRRLDKAEWAGRELIPVNPRDTSRLCSSCGHVAEGNRVTQAEFRCVACGHAANADVNAARNIAHRAGLVLREAPAA